MDVTALLIFTAALFVAAGSPGPSIAALIARVIARAHRDVLPFLVAMWVGEATWLALAVWVLVSLATTFHVGFVVLKWAGVAYLLYLAVKMWTSPAVLKQSGEMPLRDSPGRMFAAGMAVTLGNPKIMLFYLALLPTIVDLRNVTMIGWAELTATMLVVLIVIDLAWIGFASAARRLLKSPAAVRVANRCSAGLMAGAAGAIAVR